MPFTTQVYEDRPIIEFTMRDPFNPKEDVVQIAEQAAKLQEERGTRVYRIVDVREQSVTFGDMMIAMKVEREAAGGAADPNITSCFVGSHDLVRLGTSALAQQDQYGKGHVHLFETIDEAMTFIQEDLVQV